MINNYKTFLNIILSLSLILIPSYGYAQTGDSKALREVYVEHLFQYIQKQNPELKSHLVRYLGTPEFTETFRLFKAIREAVGKGNLEDYLAQNSELRDHFKNLSLQASEFQKAFHTLEKIENVTKTEEFKTYLNQSPELGSYFKELSLQVSELREKKIFHDLAEITEFIEMDKKRLILERPLSLDETLMLPIALFTYMFIAQIFFAFISDIRDISVDDMILINAVLASGVYGYNLVHKQTLSKVWHRLKNKLSSSSPYPKNDRFIKGIVAGKNPTEEVNRMDMPSSGHLLLSGLFMNVAFMYLFYGFATDVSLEEALLVTSVVMGGVTYISKNWTRLKNEISSLIHSIQQQAKQARQKSVMVEGFVVEIESQSPGIIKKAKQAVKGCLGVFSSKKS